jgi:hypothetical protein
VSHEPGGTSVQDRYVQQFAADLETSVKEQESIRSQIAELQGRLDRLKQEQTWLAGAQGAPAATVTQPPADSPGDETEAAPA